MLKWKIFLWVLPEETLTYILELGTQVPFGDGSAQGKNKLINDYSGRKFCPASPGPQV